MDAVNTGTLEQTLAKTEIEIDAAIKAAEITTAALKKARSAAKDGSLGELGKTLDNSVQAVNLLSQQVLQTQAGWGFDGAGYMADGAFVNEFIETAKAMDVAVFELDGVLYCFPFLLRVLPGEMAVFIDKTKDKRIRPSVLAATLKKIQNKPVRFKPDVFLECLYAAYCTLSKAQAEVVSLSDIYRLLTLLPGQAKEYTYQEYARDIYLLDLSGCNTTKSAHTMRLPASTGTRSSRKMIRVITKEGVEKKYYGISFQADGGMV